MRYYLEQNELNRKRHARGGERRPPLVLFLSDFERLCPQQGNAHTAKEGETYENKEKAVEGVKEKSNKHLSLNGMWRFQWVPDLTDRPADFFNTNYDDKAWDLIEVPGIWEMHGYGDPVYVNQRYEWDYLMKQQNR